MTEKAKKNIDENIPVDDETLVSLIVLAICDIEKKKSDDINQVMSNKGWILDGFPSNIAQACLLEKQLSGFDPEGQLEIAKKNEDVFLQ